MTERLGHYKLLFFLLLFPLLIHAQQYPDPKVDQLLRSGIESIVTQNYADAELKFKRLNDNYPDLPLGSIYLAAVKMAASIDYGEAIDEGYISARLNDAEKKTDKLIEKNDHNAWNFYFLALNKGYWAYFKALNRDYISAFSSGLSSISKFNKCLQMDSSFYDAYIAIGTYKYWKSAKTKWVPFVSNEKELGVQYLTLALGKNTFNHYLAQNSLMWIYINDKEYKKAADIAEKVLSKYPGNRSFKWGLGRAYQEINKRKAIEVFEKLLSSVLELKNNNHYNEIILKHKLALLNHEVGDNKTALRLCDEILSLKSLSDYVTDRLDDRLDKVKKLREELLRL